MNVVQGAAWNASRPIDYALLKGFNAVQNPSERSNGERHYQEGEIDDERCSGYQYEAQKGREQGQSVEIIADERHGP